MPAPRIGVHLLAFDIVEQRRPSLVWLPGFIAGEPTLTPQTTPLQAHVEHRCPGIRSVPHCAAGKCDGPVNETILLQFTKELRHERFDSRHGDIAVHREHCRDPS